MRFALSPGARETTSTFRNPDWTDFRGRLTHLDSWKTGLLLTIKRNIAEEPGLV